MNYLLSVSAFFTCKCTHLYSIHPSFIVSLLFKWNGCLQKYKNELNNVYLFYAVVVQRELVEEAICPEEQGDPVGWPIWQAGVHTAAM